MVDRLIRAEGWLVRLEGFLIFCAFAGLVAIMLLQVIYRFILSEPLAFTEEVSRICMIWLVFIGAARALYMTEHFIVDVLVKLLPASIDSAIGYLVDLVVLVFIAALAYIALRSSLFGSSQIMPALGVSVAVQTIAMPIGFFLMFLHAMMFVVRRRHIGVPTSSAEGTRRRVKS